MEDNKYLISPNTRTIFTPTGNIKNVKPLPNHQKPARQLLDRILISDQTLKEILQEDHNDLDAVLFPYEVNGAMIMKDQ